MPRTPEDYIEAVREAQGLLTVAARRLGVGRSAIYDMAKRHPEVQEAIDEARERMTDLAEGKLYSKISDGDITSIIFYLKTQGKRRGYVEKQEIEHQSHGDIVIDLTRVGHSDGDG